MKKNITIATLVVLALTAYAADDVKVEPAALRTAGLVQKLEVQAGAVVQKPTCAKGLHPMVIIEPEKGTAKGVWSAINNDVAWRILFNGKPAPHKVMVAVYCQPN